MAKKKRYSGMAIAGFVCSFFIPLLGIIFSAIASHQTKVDKNLDGRSLAIAGLVISIVSMVAWVFIAAAWIAALALI
jgi:hypothetical protein